MDIIQVSVLAVTGVLLAMVLKKERPEYGILLSMVVCVFIFFRVLGRLSILLESVNRLRALSAMDSSYLRTVFKMIGITYVAEFAVNLCRDAGYSAIASQIELFSKISILLLALPVIEAFLQLLTTVAA